MAKGVIMQKGAGGSKLFAAIDATYPVGSSLTCTKGSKTLRAKDDSGHWIFPIPEAGEWTLTATSETDPSKTKSQKVTIETEGQFETVELSYELVLFDGGDNTDVTGGWGVDGHDSPTAVVGTTVGLNINTSTLSSGQVRTFIVATKNTINLSGYTKLCATITELSATQGEVRVVSSINSDATAKASVTAKVGTVEVDISSTDSGKVGLWISLTSNAYAQMIGSISASKIWLS